MEDGTVESGGGLERKAVRRDVPEEHPHEGEPDPREPRDDGLNRLSDFTQEEALFDEPEVPEVDAYVSGEPELPDGAYVSGEPDVPEVPEVDAYLSGGPDLPEVPDDVARVSEEPEVIDEPAVEHPAVSRSVVDDLADDSVGPTEAPPAPLALYRRYRPDTFAEVIGQEHVTEPLQRALTNNRVNHAYLFSGPRGCGKTTSARILARCLNCENGPRAEPCGRCQSCRDLARGGPGSIDVIEIDAASHGGVDDARDLRERAFFAPVSSRYKIYVVDEAHMVTTAGFNALLKLVEEPPPHVKFIFATTEPDKVIGTIRSRTHHYPFRLVPPRVLGGYLAKLCEAEGIAVEPAVLPLVVRAGAGSVRDSLSVLDQLLGGADDGGVSYGHAAALLGYTPDSLLDEFVDAFAAGDPGGVFACVDKVIEVGQDPRRFAEDLLRRLRDLLVVVAVPDALSSGLVEVSGDQAERLSSQAAALGPGELTRAAEVIAAGLTEMRGTTAPRLHLELMCARILLPGADVDGRGIHARLDRLERRIGMTAGAHSPALASEAPGSIGRPALEGQRLAEPANRERAGAATSGAQPTVEPERQQAGRGPAGQGSTAGESASGGSAGQGSTAGESAGRGPAGQGSSGRGPVGRGSTRSGPGVTAAGEQPAAPGERPPEQSSPEASPSGATQQPAETVRSSLSVTDVRRLWPEVLEEVKGRRRFTWILLSQNAHVADVSGDTLLLAMPNAGARDSFAKGGNEDILREALVVALGVDLRVSTMVDPSAAGGSRQPTAGSAAPPTPPAPSRPPAPAPHPAAVPPPASPPPAPSGSASSAVQRGGEQARQAIRPTRGGPRGGSDDDDDDRDAAADRDDAEVDDSGESHAELLARQLGAQIIAEEDHGT